MLYVVKKIKVDRDKMVVKPDTNQIKVVIDDERLEEIKDVTDIEYKAVCKECFIKEMAKYEKELANK